MALNPVIERLEQTGSFEHRGHTYAIGRATPLGICRRYHDLIVERKLGRILEIGTLYGQSTLFLGEAARAIDGHVTTVDLRPEMRTWMDGAEAVNLHEVAERFVHEAGLDEFVSFVAGDSNAVLPEMVAAGRQFDFVLIDGGHEFAIALLDFINADRLTGSGALIAMDDIGAGLAVKPEFNGAPNRLLPMIFASGRFTLTMLNANVVVCEKL